jgi:hypothetical protein
VLVRVGPNGYEVVFKTGPVEDGLDVGTTWTASEVFRGQQPFAAIAAPFHLRVAALYFEIGETAYWQVCVAAAEIPDDIDVQLAAFATWSVVATAVDDWTVRWPLTIGGIAA